MRIALPGSESLFVGAVLWFEQLKKKIRERFEDLEVMKHYYCKGCLALLKSDAPCDGPLCLNTTNGTFVTTSIAVQVKRR